MEIYTQAGDNQYSQIGDNSKASSSYYKKMHFAYLDYEDKTIDLNKLKYIYSSINVYNNEKSYELGEIRYESLDEEILSVNEAGLIIAKSNASRNYKSKNRGHNKWI